MAAAVRAWEAQATAGPSGALGLRVRGSCRIRQAGIRNGIFNHREDKVARVKLGFYCAMAFGIDAQLVQDKQIKRGS